MASVVTPSSHSRGRTLLRSLSTSALALAVVIGALLEVAVFRYGYLLADRSTLTIVHKGARLEAGHREDAIIIGPSTALAIDAHQMSQATGRQIYNYALPNLGSAEQYYFVLEKYLRYNPKPDRIVLGLPPDTILNETSEHADPFIEAIERQRFRRFFGSWFLATDIAPETRRWPFLVEAAATALPSVNYRVFIKSSTLMPEADEVSDFEPAESVRALYARNRQILDGVDATNGQLLYYEERVVSEDSIAHTMPSAPNPRAAAARSIEKAIRLADSAGIDLTLIFTPMCDERAAEMEQTGSWTLLTELINKFQERYRYFRYVQASGRSYPREFFGDAVHLNARGALRFNGELATRAGELFDRSAGTPVLPR